MDLGKKIRVVTVERPIPAITFTPVKHTEVEATPELVPVRREGTTSS